MGVFNLGWVDLQPDHPLHCRSTLEQWKAGWPESLSNSDIAKLQRPLPSEPHDGAMWVLSVWCGVAYALKRCVRIDHTEKIMGDEFSFHKAADIAAWLASQREEPSVHIRSWFDAYSVSTNPQAVTVTPEAAQAVPNHTAPKRIKTPRKGWQDIAGEHTAKFQKTGRYMTAKALYDALYKQAGDPTSGSPFIQGKDGAKHLLVLAETNKPVTRDTFKNCWPSIREAAKK